jgi:hypothetical protein
MFSRAYPHGSASIAALAGGEIGANRQVCPTIGGGCVKLRPFRPSLPNFTFTNKGKVFTGIDFRNQRFRAVAAHSLPIGAFVCG